MNKEVTYFNFRIITCADGTEVIDDRLKTPENSLTPAQMMEYTETEKQLAQIERLKKKKQKEAEHKRKIARNPLYRFACMCGLV